MQSWEERTILTTAQPKLQFNKHSSMSRNQSVHARSPNVDVPIGIAGKGFVAASRKTSNAQVPAVATGVVQRI